MKVGFNMGVDPVDYKQAEVDENDLQFAAQMGATHVDCNRMQTQESYREKSGGSTTIWFRSDNELRMLD